MGYIGLHGDLYGYPVCSAWYRNHPAVILTLGVQQETLALKHDGFPISAAACWAFRITGPSWQNLWIIQVKYFSSALSVTLWLIF